MLLCDMTCSQRKEYDAKRRELEQGTLPDFSIKKHNTQEKYEGPTLLSPRQVAYMKTPPRPGIKPKIPTLKKPDY